MEPDFSVPDRIAVRKINALPDAEQLAQLLSAVARPFVITSDRELSVLRRGLTKEGWKRSLYLQDAPPDDTSLLGAGLLARANQWLDATVNIPLRGGDCDDFVCVDGHWLEAPPDHAAVVATYRCPACGRTYSGEKYDAAARCHRHHALASGCLALAIVYQIDRDPEYAEKAAEILRGYTDHYPGRHTTATDGGMLHHSLDEARWIIPLAQAYDLIYHSKALFNGDRAAVEDKLFRRVAEGLAKVESAGAQAAWHLSAIGVIGGAIKDPYLFDIALRMFDSQVGSELGEDGIWSESVHGGHFQALKALVHMAEVSSRIGIDLYNFRPGHGGSLKSMFLAPVNYVYPSFEIPAINDGNCGATLPLSLYEIAFRRWAAPTFAWVLKTGYGYSKRPISRTQTENRAAFTRGSLYAFLFGRDLPGRVQKPRIESTDFTGLGVCTLRSDCDTMLTLNYGRSDKMAITLYAADRVLAADYGTPGRGSDVFGYYEGTSSHNTVVVDGKSHAGTLECKLTLFRPGSYLQVAEAVTEEAYPGVKHVRRTALLGDIVLVQDSLSSAEEHIYDWLLRSEGELHGVPADAVPAQAVSERFEDARGLTDSTDFIVGWQDEGAGLAAWLSTDTPGTLVAARCPAETAARMVPVVDLRRRSSSAGYMAILAPYRQDIPIIKRAGTTIKIACGSTVDWVRIGGVPGSWSEGGEFESDAEFAAVREVDGNIVAFGLYRGSYIRLKGDAILLGARPFEWMEARLDAKNPVVNFEGASGDYLRLKCNARAMRVNGHRISAANFDGMASIRLVGMLAEAVTS